ncbi:MAG TPA: NAD(P)H-dependent oxidoreductase [Luteibacter sp.]|jgi:FMN-dependent NADH-azoreductase|uniref:FMN-dependent NADH-azoreductase n=1 Tax=Luteibacter sp. TaxID=1886636 RepID=UPI002F3F6C67
MNILHVLASPRGPAAESYQLSLKIVAHLLAKEPGARVVQRVLSGEVPPHIDSDYAFAQHAASAATSPEGSLALSDTLIAELKAADVVVIGTPMHNTSVPSALKAWIDHIVRARVTFDITAQGKVGLLHDRPVYIAVASGGRFTGEHARQPDFLTPYLTYVLDMIGLRDVTFFTVQGTVMPADVLAQARATTDHAMREHFASTPA